VSTGVHPVAAGEAEKRRALRDLGRREGMAALVQAWLPPMLAPARRGDEAFVQPLRAMCEEAGLATFEAQIEALLARPDAERLLPAIGCPTLVAVGSEDAWSPPAQHARIAQQISGARLVVIEGAGHMLPVEAPEELNAAIALWMSEASQA
jgi:pimeloyl-ACP methyl ester carboxylesterase